MGHNARRIQSLIEGVSVEQARWKPTADTWSILEVINHLYDEEKFDFRVRLDIILHHPDEPWPPIDPAGWVTERQYNQRELAESLAGFLRARKESLHWLKGLSAPDWETVYQAPFGPITAGAMFASWAAHDLLHTRQLVELHWAYVGRLVEPYEVRYAGSWE
ncbi:MAG: DinB family protein [Chloroflexi bacterium]|nr:DinB family protein [Chloroflexota bacterium]